MKSLHNLLLFCHLQMSETKTECYFTHVISGKNKVVFIVILFKTFQKYWTVPLYFLFYACSYCPLTYRIKCCSSVPFTNDDQTDLET